MSLRDEIDAECRLLGERREAVRVLSSFSLVDCLTAHNEAPPSQPYVVSRDPCPLCAIRGDIGCAHRRASRPEEAPARRWRNPEQLRRRATG